MGFLITFITLFFWMLGYLSPIIIALVTVIGGLGLVVGRREGWPRVDSLYFAFITATTVGYGDMLPTKRLSKYLSIVIALTGLLLTGIIVATAIESISIAARKHLDLESAQEEIKTLLHDDASTARDAAAMDDEPTSDGRR
jgi:voltage-gated potassium channel